MHYDPDYDIPESPQLQAVHVKAKPSPPPLPFIPRPPLSPIRLGPQSQRERKKLRGRGPKPSLGDAVLLGYLGPNYPDVARKGAEISLDPGSDFESSDGGEMEDRPGSRSRQDSTMKPASPDPKVDIARKVTQLLHAQTIEDGSGADGELRSPESQQGNLSPSAPLDIVNLQISALEPDGSEARRPDTSGSAMVVDGPSPNGHPVPSDSLATSPQLREHTIPDSEGPATEKLPALYSPHPSSNEAGPGSPNQIRPLPAFSELNKLAEAASHDQDSRSNGFPHRQSISSANGQQLPVLTQVSPVSANGETPASDGWKHLPVSPQNMPPTPGYDRRFSLASDVGPSPHAPQPAGGPTPETQESAATAHPTPADPAQIHRMSIDVKTRVLPLPVASMGGAGVTFPTATTGTYRCDFPGCNVPPFQTQYLLNSHLNVHSQNRPHYCPVRGCPRGEGGRGFKRKNEMIRHGLVHDSPGYVCPFCPEREHRYPRPDNLQRHVRVHHVDKDKDDAALRDVLAQRPEGPSRGRRRRVGS